MSSSARQRPIITASREEAPVFLMGTATAHPSTTTVPIATAGQIVGEAEARAGEIIAEASRHAAALVATAQAEAGSIRDDAFQQGFSAGEQQARHAAAEYLALIRQAASDGKAVRDSIAAQASGVIARAVGLATRGIVATAYAADPALTTAACEQALRAAAGQAVLRIRVNPAVAAAVQATLRNLDAGTVQSDEAVAIGGCLVDLRNGTIDASLDARLDLLDLALGRAAGEQSA